MILAGETNERKEGFAMAYAKRASKQKRRKMALPAWGAAGISLAMAGSTSAAVAPTADAPSRGTSLPSVTTLGEEEISDISLSTFYVFDKEAGGKTLGQRVAFGCRCGGGCGCRACRCGGGCGCRIGGCGCGIGGCGCGIGGCACVVIGCAGCAGCGCSCCLSWGSCQLC
jgi:hypothetical protein